MIDSKQTLKNLHKEFPELTLDDLFKVLDCYVEETYISNIPWTTDKPLGPTITY